MRIPTRSPSSQLQNNRTDGIQYTATIDLPGLLVGLMHQNNQRQGVNVSSGTTSLRQGKYAFQQRKPRSCSSSNPTLSEKTCPVAATGTSSATADTQSLRLNKTGHWRSNNGHGHLDQTRAESQSRRDQRLAISARKREFESFGHDVEGKPRIPSRHNKRVRGPPIWPSSLPT